MSDYTPTNAAEIIDDINNNATSTGDTVTIPAGTFDCTATALEATAGVTISGAGKNVTIVQGKFRCVGAGEVLPLILNDWTLETTGEAAFTYGPCELHSGSFMARNWSTFGATLNGLTCVISSGNACKVWLDNCDVYTATDDCLSSKISTDAATATNATNKIVSTQDGWANNDRLQFDSSVPPTGLADDKDYYVINVENDGVGGTNNQFQVALTSGGAAVTFSDDGTTVRTAGPLNGSFVKMYGGSLHSCGSGVSDQLLTGHLGFEMQAYGVKMYNGGNDIAVGSANNTKLSLYNCDITGKVYAHHIENCSIDCAVQSIGVTPYPPYDSPKIINCKVTNWGVSLSHRGIDIKINSGETLLIEGCLCVSTAGGVGIMIGAGYGTGDITIRNCTCLSGYRAYSLSSADAGATVTLTNCIGVGTTNGILGDNDTAVSSTHCHWWHTGSGADTNQHTADANTDLVGEAPEYDARYAPTFEGNLMSDSEANDKYLGDSASTYEREFDLYGSHRGAPSAKGAVAPPYNRSPQISSWAIA